MMTLEVELAATNALHLRAIRLLNHPEIKAAQAAGERELLQSLPFVDAESLAIFADASREITTAALLFALIDPEYPIVLTTELMPRMVDGADITGSRAMDDNPDTVYRFMPVDVDGRYVIRGVSRDKRPTIHQFSLISEDWTTQHNFTAEDIDCDENGVFEIEMDCDPPAGRRNHIQSKRGACFLHVRDTLTDWSRELPSLLEIRRTNATTRPPLTDEQALERCVSYVRDWYKKTTLLHDEAVTRPANEFVQPLVRNRIAMLVTQAYSIGRFAVDAETALVLTLRQGGAGYLSIALTNLWGITNDPMGQQASLNTTQSVRNDDGSYTYVVSLVDPGIANWIDPGGIPQGILFLRWAAIDPEYAGEETSSVEFATVPLAKLDRHLGDVPQIGPEERRASLAERTQLFDRRWR